MPEDTPRSDWDFNAERFASAQPTGSSTPEREAVASSETIRKAKSRGSRYSEIGSSGLRETGGFIHEEFLPALRGPKGDAVWREMQDNDPVIGGILHGIEMLARKVEWQVDPAEPAEVEEIVAQRQKERATAMAAAEAQAQQQAEREAAMQESMVAQADAAKQSSASNVKKGHTRANSPTAGQQVAKALTALGSDPSLHHGSLARLDAAIDTLGRATASRTSLRDRQLDAHIEAWSARLAKAAGDGEEAAGSKKAPKKKPSKPGASTTAPEPPSPESFMEAAALQGEEDAVFVETAIHDMHPGWESTLSEILTFLPYGWSFHEIVYKRRQGNRPTPQKSSMFNDGMVGWSGLPGRAQETRWRWEFGANGEIEGMHQMDPYRGGRHAYGATPNPVAFGATSSVYIPMTKALLFRTTAKRNNPEGRSVLRNAYRPWYMKKRIEEIEAIGIERDLAGFPVAYVPYHWMTDTATDSEAAALDEIKNIVRNIKRDEQEGAVFPRLYEPESNNPLFELELLSTGGSRQFDTSEIISRYDKRIAMTVLADFILLGQDNVGSFALGKTKVDLFTAALEAWMDAIAEVFNVDAIPRLMKVNGKDPAASPILAHGTMSQVDLTELADFLQKLSQAGAPLFPDDNLESHIRQAAGLPDIQSAQPNME